MRAYNLIFVFSTEVICISLFLCLQLSVCLSVRRRTHIYELTEQSLFKTKQVAQLSQRDRAAGGGVSFGKNISAKIVHLISLYPTALTSTNHNFTVLCHPTCT